MVFTKPRYPRYAIDLSHPAIRYAIAAAVTVSGRYAATFPNNGPCLECRRPEQYNIQYREFVSQLL